MKDNREGMYPDGLREVRQALAFDLVKREEIRLMAMAEIADRLRVTRERAAQIASSRDSGFPDPIARLKAGKIYLTDDVEAWIAVHRPHLNDAAEGETAAE